MDKILVHFTETISCVIFNNSDIFEYIMVINLRVSYKPNR